MSEWLEAAQAEPKPPLGTPPSNLFFTYQKPDGDSFLAPATSVDEYRKLGYTVTGEQTIDDSDAFRAVVSPGTETPPASGVESTEATGTSGAMPQTPPAE